MRILITGGSGLLGRELTHSLTRDRHEVIILTRDPARVTGLPTGARPERWDGQSAQGWGHLADGAGAIVNLAGESIAGRPGIDRWTPARKQVIRDSRLNAGKAVVEAVQNAKQKPVVIQSSAVGYYGPCGDEEVTETHAPGKGFLAQVCVDWENSVKPIEGQTRVAIIRTGLPLSKRGGALAPLLLMFNLFAGGPLGSGKQWWPWLHMADEIGALRFLIDTPNASGAFNLSSPNPLRMGEFAKVLGKVMNRPAFMPAPAFALRLVMGELADALLLSGQRQIPQRLLQAGYKFKFPEAEAALRDTLK